MMDWMNGSLDSSFASRAENSLSFLYNCNHNLEQYYPEMKYPMVEKTTRAYAGMIETDRKKRLTNEQLESLENSFLEDQKLEPERKLKLARELSLQPRQIAIWFQNRRARWKTKELERSYDALKLEFDVVCKEKKRLQEEVLALKIILMERADKNSIGHTTENSGEEMESTSMGNPSPTHWLASETKLIVDEPPVYFSSIVDEYNPNIVPMPSLWSTALIPSYP